MDIYIPLILYTLIISLFLKRKEYYLIAFTFIPFVLFWGTKVDFGPDYASYLYKYEMQHNMPISLLLVEAIDGKFEPGFFLLLKILPSFNAVVFVQASFLIISVYIFLKEFIPKYSLPIALFLWLFNSSIFNTFSAMRSSFVIGFFLLAVIAKNRSKNVTAIILTLIGAQFHLSGYLLLLFILLPKKFFIAQLKSLQYFVAIFVIIALLVPSVFPEILSSIIKSNENLAFYENHINDTNYGMGFYLFSLIRVGYIVYILSLIKRKIIEDKYIFIAWLTIFCYLFMMVQGIEIMYRFFNYLFLATVALKCYVLKVDRTMASKIYVGLSVLYALFTFYSYMHSEYMVFYKNYHSFLF